MLLSPAGHSVAVEALRFLTDFLIKIIHQAESRKSKEHAATTIPANVQDLAHMMATFHNEKVKDEDTFQKEKVDKKDFFMDSAFGKLEKYEIHPNIYRS
tara:strand:+ start:220 stop:516 length:297 start_codon:yes stop_codon:yes gene_type:complete